MKTIPVEVTYSGAMYKDGPKFEGAVVVQRPAERTAKAYTEYYGEEVILSYFEDADDIEIQRQCRALRRGNKTTPSISAPNTAKAMQGYKPKPKRAVVRLSEEEKKWEAMVAMFPILKDTPIEARAEKIALFEKALA